ncbi:GTP 3',8-cyclase MoaA [Micavibrio aeruginosavorus]|uniref:GTP 3',8-cyclase n=1 Tax=Micavibrio aeruginosavorus EPB TaxID=349215 RepID=M4VHY3_9BACT|nr:GTP 3',8-cyclase MoaA [Micavibrio aeruginosavorus]AGH97661.1 Molybdenum cofactor biosynthesis protein MoaA [Micavibrio aeruginosavorus EPB]
MEKTPQIADTFGRRFPYLRLSLTDICNFRCSYCLPDGYKKTGCESFLSRDEILRLVRAFSGMGVWKIRLTGGEPTIRPDFIEIARDISGIHGIEKLAFTTNGYKLPERAKEYYEAGLSAINISIDSLNPRQFEAITGHDRLAEIMDGMNECFRVGFKTVKINTVLLRGMNDDEIDDFVDFVADKPVSLRFIELMRTGENGDYFSAHHLSGIHVTQRLLERGWSINPRSEGAGPAVEFSHEKSLGTIGLIAPYAKDFCKTCNRLRVSAKGNLHLCLFGEGGYPLRDLLQRDDQCQDLQDKIMNLMNFKKSSHFLHDGDTGATPHLASIGG